MARRLPDMTDAAAEKTTTTTSHSTLPLSRTSQDATPRRIRNSRKVASDVKASIDGIYVIALVDTGADYAVINGPVASKPKKVMTTWDCPHIRTQVDHPVMPKGTCTSRVTIDETTYPVAFVILPNCPRDVILGMDYSAP